MNIRSDFFMDDVKSSLKPKKGKPAILNELREEIHKKVPVQDKYSLMDLRNHRKKVGPINKEDIDKVAQSFQQLIKINNLKN